MNSEQKLILETVNNKQRSMNSRFFATVMLHVCSVTLPVFIALFISSKHTRPLETWEHSPANPQRQGPGHEPV